MTHYPEELKKKLVARMQINKEPIRSVAKETDIPVSTLAYWLREERAEGERPMSQYANVGRLSLKESAKVFYETLDMTEIELAEYAREKGLYVEEIKELQNTFLSSSGQKDQNELKKERKRWNVERKKLEAEIKKQKDLLAEATELIILAKKAQAIWRKKEED